MYVINKNEPNGKGYFHLWTEDKGGRGPEEVGNCLLTFLTTLKPQQKHLVVWSDSAGGQNKNWFIICVWHYLIKQGVFDTIEHKKFPEVGYTFMDSDRDFVCFRKSKKASEYLHSG
uniref:Uncharacterized protein LOC114325685 n=1 Tax=Diabrotica virgifera virgifera TaxID=50390 RepID=A0A6P7F7D5_DIAVI